MQRLPHSVIKEAVSRAIAEDIGRGGIDLTSAATIGENKRASALFKARQSGILSGIDLAVYALQSCDPDCEIEVLKKDGERLEAGAEILRVNGNARALMLAERTALNFLTHLSGIATLTAHFVEETKGTNAKILDTRKTLPGMRALQKYAVRCGGGHNHRFGLDDAILIKDNHIAVAGGIVSALTAAKAYAGRTVKIEIEVDTLDQLDEVLACGLADIVMLDNFSLEDLEEAVKRINGKIPCEASGGVTLKTVGAIAKTGVDYISSGALTHSAPTLDIGLDIEIKG